MKFARLLSFLATAVALAAGAQDYPNRPVKIIVSFSAGGTTDVIARQIAQRLSHYWKQPVVVENKPGAGGTLGTDLLVSQPPDGHTILMSSSGPMVISPSLPVKLNTDPIGQLLPVILVADVANVLVTAPDLNISSVEELLREARANPGKLNYASTGVGTVAHLSGAYFSETVGIRTTHVPYKGAEAVTDVMAGRVHFMFATLPSVIGQIKGGKLRPLAQVAPARVKQLPDVPTVKELGIQGLESGSWFGLFVARGTPQAIVDRINSQVNEVLREKETQEALEKQGATPVGGSAADFQRFRMKEFEMWRPIAQKAGAGSL
jgi:tripartite-type tricarboxylate transporter receptor subunit TctC